MFIRKKEFVQSLSRVLLQSRESDVSGKSRIARLLFTRSTREASDPLGLESSGDGGVFRRGFTRRKCRESSLRGPGSKRVFAGRRSCSGSIFAALLLDFGLKQN